MRTPGPWTVVPAEGYLAIAAGLIVDDVADKVLCALRLEDADDAHVIAAAPDLLDALFALTDHMDRAGGDGYGMPECPWCRSQRDDNGHAAGCELIAARAAIAKAEGRP